MSALPGDINTGVVRISLRTIGMASNAPDVEVVTGSISFTPTPAFLRNGSNGLIIPSEPVTAYLDENGDADVTLIATDNASVIPTGWTYLVEFDLQGTEIESFHIDCPAGSDRELTSIAPFQAADGVYYALGASGGDAAYFVVSETVPTETTHEGVPVVWIKPSGTLTAVPAIPTEPAWDIIARTVVVPSVVGVQYFLQGVLMTAGVVTPITGTGTVSGTVTTAALPGYVLPGVYTWTKQFPDYDSSTLYSSDTFTGSAGELLVPAIAGGPLRYGRTMDMGLGGSASPAPQWLAQNTTTGLMELTGTGEVTFERFTGSASNDSAWVDAAAPNHWVEFEMTRFNKNHGDSFSVTLARQGAGTPAGSIRMTYETGGGWRVYGPDNVLGGTLDGYLNGTSDDNSFLGVWRFTNFGQIFSVICPDSTTFSWDVSASGDDFGNYIQLNAYSNDADGGSPHIFRDLSVGRWV